MGEAERKPFTKCCLTGAGGTREAAGKFPDQSRRGLECEPQRGQRRESSGKCPDSPAREQSVGN